MPLETAVTAIRPSRFGLALLSIGMLAATPCLGHDTWLVPAPHPSGRTTLQFDLTSGEAFPQLEYPIKPERIQSLGCATSKGPCKLTVGARQQRALRLKTDVDTDAPVVAWAQLAPKVLELAPDKIGEYLDEIDAGPELRAAWSSRPDPKRWRESYIKCTKSVSKASGDDRLWSTVTGLGLELVPSKSPVTLADDEFWTMQVLRDGKPASGVAVGLSPANASNGAAGTEFQRSDSEGQVRFKKPRAGRWLLRATDLHPVNEEKLEWRSLFTTLTFELAG